MINPEEKIKNKALEMGFFSCGISKAGFLEKEAPRLEKYLNENKHGKMGYLANHFDKRLDPTLLVPGAKSVISLLYNYFPNEVQNSAAPQVSKYAYGTDYHFVIKDKLKEFYSYLQDEFGEIDGRVFVDSAPVLDKAWAAKSGLGWIGKHSNLITKKQGSFFFISEIIVDLELTPDAAITDHCGTCTKCIDACPTDAIVAPYEVDGSKCISYFTIELRNDVLPSEMKGKFENWMFGCDICQDVCPWNRFSSPHQEPLFNPHPKLLSYSNEDWQEITEEVFREIFKKSAVKRTKFKGLTRNLKFLANNTEGE